MQIVLVKRIHIAGANWIHISVCVFHFTAAGNAIARFEVVLVLQQRFGASSHHGMADRVTKAVAFGQETMTRSRSPFDEVLRFLDVRQTAYKHDHSIFTTCWKSDMHATIHRSRQ
ncbi:hypothetical protein WL60_10225 [Burkholderia ubonensis]|nr:hypothetical protein WL60_10225 [Burkholderia ubonensis]